MSAADLLFGRRVDPTRQEVVKLVPANPPERGEIVLVDGERCRVSFVRVKWNGCAWEMPSLRVRAARGETK